MTFVRLEPPICYESMAQCRLYMMEVPSCMSPMAGFDLYVTLASATDGDGRAA